MPMTTTTETFNVAPPSALEEQLLQFAMASYRDTLAQLTAGGQAGISFQSAANPTLSPQLQQFIQEQQRATTGIASRAITGGFADLQRQINADFSARGALNSSANMAVQTRLAEQQGARLADVADQARGQAAGQAFQGAFQQQANTMQLLGMLQNLQLQSANPQLLRDLMGFRQATAGRTTKQKTPFDIVGLLGAAGNAYGQFRGGQ